MASNLPPVPHNAPMTGPTGVVSPAWSDLLQRALTWTGSHAASGYERLPSGLYLQWGVTGSVSSAATESVTFPIEFPTSCLIVIPGIKSNSGVATTATGQPGVGNYAATGFDLYNRTSVSLTFQWFAVGC